ncbi:hypothetical protein [Kitasatospora sp. NPDC056184]|uniref:hypothetical protein n=1 Tax=Kitasatospora sp. NPDC056184 TaxID=3345738 RepID=UPI0035D7A2C3
MAGAVLIGAPTGESLVGTLYATEQEQAAGAGTARKVPLTRIRTIGLSRWR